ncbi:unnamed protein product, partial [marine sediment metagenome]
DLFALTTGRSPSRYTGDDRKLENEGKPAGPYFPPFIRAALGRDFPVGSSLNSLIDEANYHLKSANSADTASVSK